MTNYNISRLILKVFTADVLFKAILSVISLLIIRYMDVDQYSLYAIIITTLSIIATMISSAFNRIFIVEDFEKDNIDSSSFLMFQLILVLIAFLFLIPFFDIYRGLYFFTILLVISQVFIMFIQTCYQRILKFSAFYRVEFFRVLLFLTIFGGLLFRGDLTAGGVVLAQAVSGLAVFLFFGRKLFTPQAFLSLSGVRLVIGKICSRQVRPLFAYYGLFTILLNCDVLLLGRFSSNQVIAEYAAGFRYYAIMQMALTSINNVLFPYIQKEECYKNIRSVLNKHRTSAKYYFIVVVIAVILSKFIIPNFDGGKYPNSIFVFQILAISSFISYIYSPYINVVLKDGCFSYLLYLISILLPSHIVLNIYMQIYFGSIGIAFLNLFSYGAFNFFVYKKSNKILSMADG